jgi:selenide,water dikinase
MTDVTGFGLAGHLREVCEGSALNAVIDFAKIPLLDPIHDYLDQGCTPGGAVRNYESFGHVLGKTTQRQREILCDPQTSGGLLVMVSDKGLDEFLQVTQKNSLQLQSIGQLVTPNEENSALITVI